MICSTLRVKIYQLSTTPCGVLVSTICKKSLFVPHTSAVILYFPELLWTFFLSHNSTFVVFFFLLFFFQIFFILFRSVLFISSFSFLVLFYLFMNLIFILLVISDVCTYSPLSFQVYLIALAR
jgi:hypothetical protein